MLFTEVRVTRSAGILLTILAALNAQSVNPTVTVPRTVRYTGSIHPASGMPAQAVESVTLAVYRDQTGGDPLWQETQNVQVDASGNFVVEMGATQSDGLPLDLLRTGERRWVGVRVNRPDEVEQPRVQILSVPYALRVSDADTLGGIPASAYLLNPSAATLVASSGGPTVAASASTNAVKPRFTSGTANYLAMFTNATDLGNSALYNSGTRIGLGTTNPLDIFHVSFYDTTGAFTGYAVQNIAGGANSYSGSLFYDQNGALSLFQGFNNSTHEYRINNIASNGSINFMQYGESNFQVLPGGDINIAGSILKGGALFLHSLGTGDSNTAVGLEALSENGGASNTALGYFALTANRNGSANTASGYYALGRNITGNFNTAIGLNALLSNTSGSFNTAIGSGALVDSNGSNNIAVGTLAGSALTDGSNNILIGYTAAGLPSLSNTIFIGDGATQTRAFIGGIRGVTTGNKNAVPVMIDSSNELGTVNSSRRFKEDIQDMGDASSNLLRLRPVTYRYKQPYTDGSKPIDYGLIAEEVAEVYPDLVVSNKDGQVETVQYQKLTPMMLNELQKQVETIRLRQQQIHKLEARIAALEALLSGKIPATTSAR